MITSRIVLEILHLTPYYAPAYAFGGVVRSVEGMALALARRGHHITILTTDALDQHSRGSSPGDEIINGARVLRVPNISPRLRGRFNLSTPQGMKALARDLLPEMDIVHCHEFRTIENLLVTPEAASMRKPLILSPHGTLARDTGRSTLKIAWDRLLSPAVAQRFDHIIGLTMQEIASAQALWPNFGRRRIPAEFSVIPNGIEPDEYANLPGREQFRESYRLGDAPVCLFMGRLHPRKGALLLAKAFRAANILGARLVIAGPDEGEMAQIQALNDERIILTGYLGGKDRLAAFAAADVFALPAIGEGLPMVVLEAMGAGLPAIVSPGCNLPEVAEQGAGLEIFPEVEPLAEALKKLLADADQRAQMSTAAAILARKNFNWDSIAIKLEQVYYQVLNR
jgi:glycosyltransferase involved in cell wall biosynthesis